MKCLIFLFVAHISVCAAVGWFFHERRESHRDYDPPVETTTAEQRARGMASFHLSESHIAIGFPGALILYFGAGLLALAVALMIELYQRFFSH